MENIFYLVYIHNNFIEGITLNKNNNNINITNDIYDFKNTNIGELDKKIDLSSNYWGEHLEYFLDFQKWRDHPIAFILPSEEIIFRKIRFPFQDRKKVEQALPYELEEELIINLSECTYSTKVQTLHEQKSDALILLIGNERLKNIQKICLDRDLLIRNVDSSAYALFRSKIFNNSSKDMSEVFFQVYLGSDEAFVNTIKGGHLDEIKIFPNRITEILQEYYTENEKSLPAFLTNFSRYTDRKNQSNVISKNAKIFHQLKIELQWLCSQLTLHLRIKNFKPENEIETYGIFGPLVKWDGLIFRERSFPLPESETFADRIKNKLIKNESSEIKLKKDIPDSEEIKKPHPNTLQELMEEAKHREESNEKTLLNDNESNTKPSEINIKNFNSKHSLESIDPKTSILSMIERKHWGILGDLRNQAEIFLEPHILSLFYERTPWRRLLRKNKVKFSFAVSFFIIITLSFGWEKYTKYNQLKKEVNRAKFLIKSEIRRALPGTQSTRVDQILKELSEKINNRKDAIKASKKFEKREYKNLNFLKNLSQILDKEAPFQIDSLELAPERFSISGTIDTYDRLQIFKKKLEGINEFYGKRILESNRKSPNGIVFRILIEL